MHTLCLKSESSVVAEGNNIVDVGKGFKTIAYAKCINFCEIKVRKGKIGKGK